MCTVQKLPKVEAHGFVSPPRIDRLMRLLGVTQVNKSQMRQLLRRRDHVEAVNVLMCPYGPRPGGAGKGGQGRGMREC